MAQLDHEPELVERTERITAGSAAEQLAAPEPPQLVDVRTAREWTVSGARRLGTFWERSWTRVAVENAGGSLLHLRLVSELD